jgi:hypothetical protein
MKEIAKKSVRNSIRIKRKLLFVMQPLELGCRLNCVYLDTERTRKCTLLSAAGGFPEAHDGYKGNNISSSSSLGGAL